MFHLQHSTTCCSVEGKLLSTHYVWPQHSITCPSVERELLCTHCVWYTALNLLLVYERELGACVHIMFQPHHSTTCFAVWKGDHCLHIMFQPQHPIACCPILSCCDLLKGEMQRDFNVAFLLASLVSESTRKVSRESACFRDAQYMARRSKLWRKTVSCRKG